MSTFLNLNHSMYIDDDLDYTILGAPLNQGVTGRVGQADGPFAVRKIGLNGTQNMFHNCNIADLVGSDGGDIYINQIDKMESLDSIEKHITKVVNYSKLKRHGWLKPYVIGGNHLITLGELRALAKIYECRLGLIHIDAHHDTRDISKGEKYNHGTLFRRAMEEELIHPDKCVQIGIRGPNNPTAFSETNDLGFRIFTMDDLYPTAVSPANFMQFDIGPTHPTFLTIDIDAVDPAYAPGTGTPVPGGFTSREIIDLVRDCRGVNIVGADIVELCPNFDYGDITALLVNTLLFEIVSLLAIR